MARILYADEMAEWRTEVRRELADHHVDLAGTHDEALRRLIDGPRHDLALIDLNLVADLGGLGAELLDVLRARYPDTRRMIIASAPPTEAVRRAVLTRHGAERLLVKAGLTATCLRHAVEELLDLEVSPDARIRRAERRRRYQQWWRRVDTELTAEARGADLLVRNTETVHGAPRHAALAQGVARATARHHRFTAEADDLCRRIEDAATIQATLDVADAFEYLRARWADADET
jgi:CheY-like chemotaxis protein